MNASLEALEIRRKRAVAFLTMVKAMAVRSARGIATVKVNHNGSSDMVGKICSCEVSSRICGGKELRRLMWMNLHVVLM